MRERSARLQRLEEEWWEHHETRRQERQSLVEESRRADDDQEIERLRKKESRGFLRRLSERLGWREKTSPEKTVTFEGRSCDSLLPAPSPTCEGKTDLITTETIGRGEGCCMNGNCYTSGRDGSLVQALLSDTRGNRDPFTREELPGLSRALALHQCSGDRS